MRSTLAPGLSAPAAHPRLIALDLLRGLTVAGMILVNTAGDGSVSYPQLRHSVWNGCTFTDLVFPMFLFIMGVSLALSFSARLRKGAPRRQVALQVLRRSAVIVVLGLVLNALSNPHLATLRYCGVLQRIGVCYLVASLVALWLGTRGAAVVAAVALAGYWLLLTHVRVPGFGYPGVSMPVLDPVGNLASYLDRAILPQAHRYHFSFYDPEGILSTIPAIASTLLGVLTAAWLGASATVSVTVAARRRRLGLLALAGLCSMAAGLAWAHAGFPFNKRLWTSSYVLWTGGISITLLALLSLAVDQPATDRPTPLFTTFFTPWLAFGTNALSAYIFSEVLAIVLDAIPVPGYGTLQHWLYLRIPAGLASAPNRSLLFSLLYVGVCLAPVWWLYRRRIFIKL
jgi:predicted acyltransferase